MIVDLKSTPHKTPRLIVEGGSVAATTTRKGLRVRAELDGGHYPKGIKVTDEELKTVHIVREDFHGEWNYSILPSNG